jgi:N-acyl-D-aspartate/D-glutamate deacylase
MVGRGVPTGYGAAIHDYSYPTFLLTHWTRDRAAGRITIAEAVRMLTSVPADLVGLRDRGRLRVGAKADLNVIDYDALGLEQPRLERDLAAGGRRLHQGAVGYRATIVGGQCITVDGRATGRLHGRRVRAVNATVRAANSVFGLLC